MNTDISRPGPSANGAMEKTVIASNFTYMLDAVGALIQSRGYGTCLRIDGGVAVDKRQGIVDRFNRQSDQNRFFLLSSKAGKSLCEIVLFFVYRFQSLMPLYSCCFIGGVGLNL